MSGYVSHLADRLQRKLGMDDLSLAQEHERLKREFAEIAAKRAARGAPLTWRWRVTCWLLRGDRDE